MPLHWPQTVEMLRAIDLPKVVKSHPLVGIHCWASWNGHDHVFAKELAKIGEAAPTPMALYALDEEEQENRTLLEKWRVLNVPALIIYQDGKFGKTFFMERETVVELLQRITRWLSKE